MRRPPLFVPIFVAAAVTAAGVSAFALRHFAKRELAVTAERQNRPRVTLTRPAADADDVPPVTGIAADIYMPTGAGVDPATLAAGVRLVRTRDGKVVDALANTTGSGDAVILKPHDDLEPGTQYAFEVADALHDTNGAKFVPYKMTFTTATDFKLADFPAAFEKVDLGVKVEMNAYTALTIGPDGDLYAGSFGGMIYRFGIAADGKLTEKPPVATLLAQYHGPRLITGIRFDLRSTAAAPVLWVSHGEMAMTPEGKMEGAHDWTGAISRLVGPGLDKCEDVVVHLPRAYKDHLNFQLDFGPDGALYFTQGSHTSDGSPDKKWGFRPERVLSGAMLRLDVLKLKTLPLDAQTEEGGTYDPTASDAALTIYATGIRSGYDVLWHSNAHLYTAVNGAAGGGGNAPASPDGKTPALSDIKTTTNDVLLDVKPRGYYGQPNPARSEFVLMGANPTAGADPEEIPEYPVGTRPDSRWAPPAFVFGKNYSCNGLLEYKTPGPLAGCILTTRYSDGDDILVLRLAPDGTVSESIAGLDGFTQFTDPLDLIEDPKTGNLYVAEYAGRSIVLLRPVKDGVSRHARRVPTGSTVTTTAE